MFRLSGTRPGLHLTGALMMFPSATLAEFGSGSEIMPLVVRQCLQNTIFALASPQSMISTSNDINPYNKYLFLSQFMFQTSN